MIRSTLRAPALLFLGTCLIGGCSKSEAAKPSSPGMVRLDVLPTSPEPRPRDVVVASQIEWPEDTAGILVSGARVRSQVPEDQGARRLLVAKEIGSASFPRDVRIKFRAEFLPGTFNKLVFPVATPRDGYVRAIFLRDGKPIVGSQNRARMEPRSPNSPMSSVVLDVPGTMRTSLPLDEVELIFDHVNAPFQIGPLELCNQPVWAWLPAAEDGFGMVSLGTDSRTCVGLSTARTLETEFNVPRGSDLRFSVGIPKHLRFGGMKPMVRVEVTGEKGKPFVQKIPLESDLDDPSRWHRVRIPLEEFADQHVRIAYSFSIANEKREAVCALSRPRIEAPKEEPRTVLLVTSDTHRADHVGAANLGVDVETPAIDALASRGVLFEDCWSSTNVTIPSHAALMTATTPRDTGVIDNYTRLSRDARTLAEAFQDAGFATYAVVSAPHLSDAASGLGQGFDRLSAPLEVNKRRSPDTIKQLLPWLDDAAGQDLFIWVHLFDAHTPYEPPPEFEARYWPAGRDAMDPSLPEPKIPPVFATYIPPGVRDLGLLSARYSAEVSFLDAQLAEVFAIPRIQSGVIALTADHGESLGEHGIYWEHAGLYTQSIHVPLILAWPGAPAGTRVQEPVFQLDLAQTLLRLSGIEDPSIPGTDLLAPRTGTPAARFTVSASADRASVTKDDWHLIASLRTYMVTVGDRQKPFPKHQIELYDLSKDPNCEHNLAASEVARVRELRLLLCGWLAAAEPRGWGSRDNADSDMAAHLAQLGYASQSEASQINPIDPACDCAECAPYLPHE